MQSDREIVLEAVKSDGEVLECLSKDLRADREIVLEAVKSSAEALEYASKDLRAEREIVLQAIRLKPFCSYYKSSLVFI